MRSPTTVYLIEMEGRRLPLVAKVTDGLDHPDAKRFNREIAFINSLSHPQIVSIESSGVSDASQAYYLMKYYPEGSLRVAQQERRVISYRSKLQILRDIADALSYIHEKSKIHRDVKPGNILLENGRGFLADFGIARAVQQATGEAMTVGAVGTLHYCAPEQVLGSSEPTDAVDVYGLGATAYELFTGQVPFHGYAADMLPALHRARTPVPPIKGVARWLPPGLASAIDSSLAVNPLDRPPARALVTEIDALLAAEDRAELAVIGRRVRAFLSKRSGSVQARAALIGILAVKHAGLPALLVLAAWLLMRLGGVSGVVGNSLLGVIAVLVAGLTVTGAKNSAKSAKLRAISRSLHTINQLQQSDLIITPAGGTAPMRPQDPGARLQYEIGVLLDALLATIDQDRDIAAAIFPSKVGRTAWLLLPVHDQRCFRAVHVAGDYQGYEGMAEQHFPAFLDSSAMPALMDEFNADFDRRVGDLNALERAAAYATKHWTRKPPRISPNFGEFFADFSTWRRRVFEPKLARVASLTGWAFEYATVPIAYSTIRHCPFFDQSYLDSLPAARQRALKFRSCACIRLEVNSKPIGVLMLFDTVQCGFSEKDSVPIQIYTNLLARLLPLALDAGCYGEKSKPVYSARIERLSLT